MSEVEIACVATERKRILFAVAIGIIGGFVLLGIELFVLYKEILVFVPAEIVETLRLIASPL